MPSDRTYAFRVRQDVPEIAVACLRVGVWHIERPASGRQLRPGESVRLTTGECHARAARGVVMNEGFRPSWSTPERAVSDEFAATLPHRAGLLPVDMIRWRTPPRTGAHHPAEADGYRAWERGRVMVACRDCGLWHCIRLDDRPAPGYRFTAGSPNSCAAVIRVTVRDRMWHQSWAEPAADGRRRVLNLSTQYLVDTAPART